jgi:S-adenosylmethionine hydrolase
VNVRAECVSFLTDYGLEDGFVAACHGVLMRRAPGVPVVDVTHLVPPGDIRRGAALLAQTLPYLPAGVHLAVVDPAVGTDRRPVVVETGHGPLVGPDNGVLTWAAEALGGVRGVYVVRPETLGAGVASGTFHGRDVFAPAAGDLARGRPVHDLATPADPSSLVTLPTPVCRPAAGGVEVEVLTVDRFGNVQFAAGPSAVAASVGDRVQVCSPLGVVLARYGTTFGSVRPGEPVLYVDSASLLALAVRDGSAAALLGVRPGDVLLLRP